MIMYIPSFSDSLQRKLEKLSKRDKKRFEICKKKIDEILLNPTHYKNLAYSMKDRQEVHIAKSFVLTFRVEGNIVRFLDLEHHDKIFRR